MTSQPSTSPPPASDHAASELAVRAAPLAALASGVMTLLLTVSGMLTSVEVAARAFLFWAIVFVPVVMLGEILFPRPAPLEPLRVRSRYERSN